MINAPKLSFSHNIFKLQKIKDKKNLTEQEETITYSRKKIRNLFDFYSQVMQTKRG